MRLCIFGYRRTFLIALIWGFISFLLITFYFEFPATIPFSKNLSNFSNFYRRGNPSALYPYSVTEPKRYMLLIPAFGPNNQYRGMKEVMIAARLTNRVFVLPHFVKHHTMGPEGLRIYEETFMGEPIGKFVDVITMDEFLETTGGVIDTLIWVRKAEKYWQDQLANYLNITGLKVKSEIDCSYSEWNSRSSDPNAKVYFGVGEDFTKYFKQIGVTDKEKTLALGFPFRSLEGSLGDLVIEVSALFERSPNVRAIADKFWIEVNTNKENILAMHWRHGEQTCRVEKALLHKGYDFCFGTSAYYWSKLEDLIEVLETELKKNNLTHIYLATDSQDEELYKRLKERLPISRAKDVPCLSSITDNYLLSLVEQEICTRAKFFLASGQTTWSEFITNYWNAKSKYEGADSPVIESIDGLLGKYKKKMEQHDYWDWILKTPPIPPLHCVHDFIDYPGNDLKGEYSTSIIDCYAKCLNNPECDCWTFYERRQCYLKKAPCPAAKNISSAYVSGPKFCPFIRTGPENCFLYNADCPGYDMQGKSGITNATGCHTYCKNTPGCACWSYMVSAATCWLKYECPAYKHTDDYISASVNCAYPAHT